MGVTTDGACIIHRYFYLEIVNTGTCSRLVFAPLGNSVQAPLALAGKLSAYDVSPLRIGLNIPGRWYVSVLVQSVTRTNSHFFRLAHEPNFPLPETQSGFIEGGGQTWLQSVQP